ncbi:MAG: four helix bundle protein [Planctomycetota bacterium]|nr:four helix bundle protein [Planctomycetota bacterium]
MNRFKGDLPQRTFDIALRVISLLDDLPNNVKGWVLGKQLLRAGTSVGANLREADEAYSDRDFAHRCSVAKKEASETDYWLRLCREAGLLPPDAVSSIVTELSEVTRTLSTIIGKVQARLAREESSKT